MLNPMNVLPVVGLGFLLCIVMALGCYPHPPKSAAFPGANGWRANDFFHDEQVIELCDSIDSNNPSKIKRLAEAGADVNAIGKDGMTLLLWAFARNNLECFEMLLQKGTNPNLTFQSRFGTNVIKPGDEIIHLATKASQDGFLGAVLTHDGDPNLTNANGDTPLCLVISHAPSKKQRIRMLLDAGADINGRGRSGDTPLMRAAGWGGQYGIALFLLQNGADPMVRQQPSLLNFVDVFVESENINPKSWTTQQQSDFEQIENWLTDHGISVANVRSDHQRWNRWIKNHPEVESHKDTLGYQERAASFSDENK
ncbi:ankyrin repeat domain-containing protein [Bremerella sp. P1]|uniref:ankyrin repeat domain-containing protein n=1 Tax=Bremerella sp. P1 TaxID=3026424 RepID=UPI0023680420|nr:ankyrin repeat domain-containing protein [Bremerella sp. P1]WDI44121.1 ankyrin repeat domain-containing protein [Bremerella sp. P1]